MQNFSILDFCSDRKTTLVKLNEYLSGTDIATAVSQSDIKRRRTGSFKRYQLARYRRNPPSKRKKPLKISRKMLRKSVAIFDTKYIRLETHGKEFLASLYWQ
jgi:hypothetical protein